MAATTTDRPGAGESTAEERELRIQLAAAYRLAEDFGDKQVMLMRNHGALATGKTVSEAFMAAFYLEKACQFQVLAQSTGMPIVLPSGEIREQPGRAPGGEDRGWTALLRKL